MHIITVLLEQEKKYLFNWRKTFPSITYIFLSVWPFLSLSTIICSSYFYLVRTLDPPFPSINVLIIEPTSPDARLLLRIAPYDWYIVLSVELISKKKAYPLVLLLRQQILSPAEYKPYSFLNVSSSFPVNDIGIVLEIHPENSLLVRDKYTPSIQPISIVILKKL